MLLSASVILKKMKGNARSKGLVKYRHMGALGFWKMQPKPDPISYS